MKHLLFIATFIFGTFLFTNAQSNTNHVYVNGYTKSNGTYVQGHYRTAPNNTINDNFSTSPNVNPYTGKVGTISPSYNTNSSYNNYNSSYNTNSSFNNYNSSSIYNKSSYYNKFDY